MTEFFMVETNETGDGRFSGETHIRVWSLEEILREINRDSTCTDPEGNVTLPGGIQVMAGSALDTIDHEVADCYRPYTVDDWDDGWADTMTEWHRILTDGRYSDNDS